MKLRGTFELKQFKLIAYLSLLVTFSNDLHCSAKKLSRGFFNTFVAIGRKQCVVDAKLKRELGKKCQLGSRLIMVGFRGYTKQGKGTVRD